jgi:hypothetical protein
MAIGLRRAGIGDIDVRPDVQRAYTDWVQRRITGTVWNRGCTSWYRTASGRNTNNRPDFTFAYRARTRRFDPADYRFDEPARSAGRTGAGRLTSHATQLMEIVHGPVVRTAISTVPPAQCSCPL